MKTRRLLQAFPILILCVWSVPGGAFQMFNRATVEALTVASNTASILLLVNPPGTQPPIATFESPSPRILMGSALTVDNAHYCAEDWLSIFTVEVEFRGPGQPSPNQQQLETSVGFVLDGQPLEIEVPQFTPIRLFDDGGFPNLWARLIGQIVAPAVDDGSGSGNNPVLALGPHELTLTEDGIPLQTITFFVDGPQSETCQSICRGMNLPASCPD